MLAKRSETGYGRKRCCPRTALAIEISSLLGKASILDSQTWIKVRNTRRRVNALTALVGVIFLVGLFCHHPGALALATGHTHLDQPSVEHCWTSIASLPTLNFIPILVTILSLTLALQGRFLCESPFKPPRAFPLPRR